MTLMFSSTNTIGIIGLAFQFLTVFLAGVSAFYIWRQLKILAQAGQAQVSENLASQSIDILRHLSRTPDFYDYFYENRQLSENQPNRSSLLCSAEIVANFLEHIVLQRDSLPLASREAWMKYVCDHYESSRLVRDFIDDHRGWYADVFLAHISARTRESMGPAKAATALEDTSNPRRWIHRR